MPADFDDLVLVVGDAEFWFRTAPGRTHLSDHPTRAQRLWWPRQVPRLGSTGRVYLCEDANGDLEPCAPGHAPADRVGGRPPSPVPVKLVSYRTGSAPPLTAPAGLTAVSAGARAVALSWGRQRGATGYEYQRKLRSSGDCGTSGYGSWRSTGGEGAAHTVSGLASGRRYCFRVRAVAGRAKGPASAGVAATPASAVALVHPAVVHVREGTSVAVGVRLGQRPAANVVVAPVHPTVSEPDGDIVLPATSTRLTFTPSNWSTEQTVPSPHARTRTRSTGGRRCASTS